MLRNPIDEATRPSSEQVERRVRADTSFIAQLHDTGPKVASANNRMRLSEVIGALSYALDLTEGQPAGHSLRCTWIGMHVGQALALTADQLSDLYYPKSGSWLIAILRRIAGICHDGDAKAEYRCSPTG